MLSRVRLSEGDFKGALEAAGPVLDGSADEVTLQIKLAALLAAAVANRRTGLTGTAAELLEQALALAEPDDASRVFLDAGQPVRSAITVAMSEEKTPRPPAPSRPGSTAPPGKCPLQRASLLPPAGPVPRPPAGDQRIGPHDLARVVGMRRNADSAEGTAPRDHRPGDCAWGEASRWGRGTCDAPASMAYRRPID